MKLKLSEILKKLRHGEKYRQKSKKKVHDATKLVLSV
jgi:hypothetical protein